MSFWGSNSEADKAWVQFQKEIMKVFMIPPALIRPPQVAHSFVNLTPHAVNLVRPEEWNTNMSDQKSGLQDTRLSTVLSNATGQSVKLEDRAYLAEQRAEYMGVLVRNQSGEIARLQVALEQARVDRDYSRNVEYVKDLEGKLRSAQETLVSSGERIKRYEEAEGDLRRQLVRVAAERDQMHSRIELQHVRDLDRTNQRLRADLNAASDRIGSQFVENEKLTMAVQKLQSLMLESERLRICQPMYLVDPGQSARYQKLELENARLRTALGKAQSALANALTA